MTTEQMHVPALLQFLEGLENNNNRPWFIHNKPAYDILREEWVALCLGLTDDIRKFDKALGPVDPKKTALRIYRNLRFSRDKTPFKTQFAGAIGDRAARGFKPTYYFHINHEGTLLAGGGIYNPDKEILGNIRRHIEANPNEFSKVLKQARFNKTYGGLAPEASLSRPPKGFDPDSPHIDAIKMKHYFGIVEIDIKKKLPKDLRGDVASLFRDVYPLVRYLREASKPR